MHRMKCEEAETFHRCVAKPHRSFAELDFLSLRGCCATRSDRRASHEAPIRRVHEDREGSRPGPEALP